MPTVPSCLTHTERTLFWEYGSVFPELGEIFEELSRVREAMAKISAGLARSAFPANHCIAQIEFPETETVQPINALPSIEPVKKEAPNFKSLLQSEILMHKQYDACMPNRSNLTKYQFVCKSLHNIITKHGPQPYRWVMNWFLSKGWRKESLVEAVVLLRLKRENKMLVPTILPLPPVVDARSALTGTTQAIYTDTYLRNYIAGKTGHIDLQPAFEALLSVGIRLPTIYKHIMEIGGRKEKGLPSRTYIFD